MLWLALSHVTWAADLSGQAVLYETASNRNDDADSDITYQDYRLNVHQPLTAYLTFDASMTVTDLSTATEEGLRFGRRNESPRFEFGYTRDSFVGRVGFFERTLTETQSGQELETRSLFGYFSLRLDPGIQLSLRFQDDENLADVTIFGRDTDSRTVEFGAFLERESYSVRYTLLDQSLDSRTTFFQSDQRRHTLRANYAEQFAQGKWSVSLDGRVIRDEQTDRSPSGTFLPEPIPAVEGLAAIDTSPEFGALDPAVDLNDDDFDTPASPPIDIGGANLFRNVGLDLGFSFEMTALEVGVDRLSGSNLVWEIYVSTDNLNWQAVGVSSSTFDPVLLRYTIEFPRTTGRYVKAVNVSENAQPEVLVTEVRAFVDVEQPELRSREGTRLRGFGQVRYRPTDRFQTSLSASATDASSQGDSLVARDSRDMSVRHEINWGFAKHLELYTRALYAEARREVGTLERRTSRRVDAALIYTPLPTLEAELSAHRREERNGSRELSSVSDIQLSAWADLLPDLRVGSSLSTQQTDDDLAQFTLDDVTWRGSVEARLTDRWQVFGELLRTWYESGGALSLDGRRSFSLRTMWSSLTGLTASADVTYTDEDGRETVTQRYSVGWSPSFRLSMNASFFETRAARDNSTSVLSGSLTYRVSENLGVFSTLSRSESLTASIIKTAQIGLRVTF